MNVIISMVKNLRPDPNGHQMLGDVCFYSDGRYGQPREVAKFECTCQIPIAKTSVERVQI